MTIGYRRRTAATILEVLFATVVIVIGLLGIATLIPFAARDAQTANNHNQAVSLGLAWADAFYTRGLHISNANSSEDRFKWVWFRDYDPNNFGTGWEQFSRAGYTGAAALRVGGTTQSSTASSLSTTRIRIWGHQPVCIDPFVLTSNSGLSRINDHIQGASTSRPQWYRESVFLYFDDAYDPVVDPYGGGNGFAVDQPRMIRVGLAFSIPAGGYSPISFAPVSNQLTANLFSSTDDVVGDTYIDEANRTDISDSLPPVRLFQDFLGVPARQLFTKRFSWKATIVPEEPLPSDVDTVAKGNIYAATPARSALVSFLILHQHSSEFVSPQPTVPVAGSIEDKPTGERMVRVYPLSGNFVGGAGGRVRLVGSQFVKSDLEVGDWIMLGRYYLTDLSGRSYPYFRWYRIIGIDSAASEGPVGNFAPAYADPAPNGNQYGTLNSSEFGWSRDVVLDGPDFAFGEYQPSAPSPTTGTIVSGVVTIVERRVSLD